MRLADTHILRSMVEAEAADTLQIQRYRERSYFLREQHHLALLRESASTFTRAQLAVLTGSAFALAKPDAVRSGKLRQLVDWLRQRDFTVLYAQPVWAPHERQFEGLYKYNLTLRNEQNQIDSWWINKQIYLLGPSVCLLLGHKTGTVYSELAALKGPSDPSRGKPGELRHDLCASNTAMNLFHCSDDPLSSLRELLLFAHWDDVSSILDTIAHAPAGSLEHSAATSIAAIEAALPAPVDVAPAPVAASVICRAAMAAGLSWPEAGALRQVAQTRPGPGAPQYQALRAALAPLRTHLLANPPQDALGAAVLTLSGFPEPDDRALESALQSLRAFGVELTEWERITLQTTAHYRQSFAAAP